jgi:hypothetical protein
VRLTLPGHDGTRTAGIASSGVLVDGVTGPARAVRARPNRPSAGGPGPGAPRPLWSCQRAAVLPSGWPLVPAPPEVEARSAPARPGRGKPKEGLGCWLLAEPVGSPPEAASLPPRSCGRVPTTLAAGVRAVLRPSARHRPGRVGVSGSPPARPAGPAGRSFPASTVALVSRTAGAARVEPGPNPTTSRPDGGTADPCSGPSQPASPLAAPVPAATTTQANMGWLRGGIEVVAGWSWRPVGLTIRADGTLLGGWRWQIGAG